MLKREQLELARKKKKKWLTPFWTDFHLFDEFERNFFWPMFHIFLVGGRY